MLPENPRQPLLTLLANYLRDYPAESGMTSRYISFVEENEDCFERSLTIGHVTGSAFIIDNGCGQVLLTHHKKLGRWLQPGGHADGDGSDDEASQLRLCFIDACGVAQVHARISHCCLALQCR